MTGRPPTPPAAPEPPAPYILLTRPQGESEALAPAIVAMGYNVAVAPMLEIVPCAEARLPALAGFDGLVFTSANGVRAFADLSPERDLPAWCVGAATARAAIEAGFEHIRSGQGGAAGLAALAGDDARRLLHIAGEDVREDVRIQGIEIEKTVVYRAVPAETLPEEALALLDLGGIAAALFFSARSGEAFVRLLVRYGRTEAAKTIKALCLADSVVESVSTVAWRDVRVAAAPDRSHILALLDRPQGPS
jgi:uroporphyrinogen-III synthase